MGVITFDGQSSDYFGIEVVAPPRYKIPTEDYTATHLNGRTGDRIKAWRSYKNVDQEYTCNFILDRMMPIPGDATGNMIINSNDPARIREWLGNHYTDLTTRGFRAADVDSNGIVNETDATMIENSIRVVDPIPLPVSRYSGENFFGVVGDAVNTWLKPFYSKKEIEFILKRGRIRGAFKTDKDGYYRLEDSYFPAVYRKAIIKGDTDIENLYNQAGAFKLTFNCDPRKFYTIGEQWIDSANDNPQTPIINYSNGEVLTHSWWWGSDSDDGYNLHINNHLRYPASPLIRIYLDQSYFPSDKIPTVMQIFMKSERGAVNETRRLRFNLAELSWDNPITLYIDFATCEAYYVLANKTTIHNLDVNDSALSNFVNNSDISSFSGRITTEFKFTPDTGLLLPGNNKIKVTFWKTGSAESTVVEPRNFEVMPRWWTL